MWRKNMIGLSKIADSAICEIGSEDIVFATDEYVDMEEHDKKFHKGNFNAETMTCSLRDESAKTDEVDTQVSQTKNHLDHKAVKDLFREYRKSNKKEKWLFKKLGITDSSDKRKAENALISWASGKKDKHDTVAVLEKLSNSSAVAESGSSSPKQMTFPTLTISKLNDILKSGGKSTDSSSSNPYSKYYHSQGQRTVSRNLHKPTGLYETSRPGGRALAREEDAGINPFNKNRPSFKEHGTVPQSFTDKELGEFRYTSNGSTYPMVGNVNGRNYIVKRGILPHGVRKNDDLQEHIKYEVAADRFIREAGLNAPVCTTFERDIPARKPAIQIDEKKLNDYFDAVTAYKNAGKAEQEIFADDNQTLGTWRAAKAAAEQAKDAVTAYAKSLGKEKSEYDEELKERVKDGKLHKKGEVKRTELVKIAEYVDGGVSLIKTWSEGSKATRDKIRKQVIDTYPIISFLMNTDAYKNDNVLCDKDDNLWFIDNGACFDYRAQGGKKLYDEKTGDILASSSNKDAKPWYFERTDPTDYYTGFLGLVYDKGQKFLQEVLADVPDDELVDAAKKYNFTKLVETLPESIKNRGNIREYARNLDAVIANPPAGWLSDEEE